MSWMHPTAQYGQTPGCTVASLILSVVAAACTGLRSRVAEPTATPAPVDPAYLRKSRRDRLMATPRCASLVSDRASCAPGRALVESGSGFRHVGPQLALDIRYWSDHRSRESLPNTRAASSLFASPEVGPVLDVQIVTLLDQGLGFLDPPGLDRLDDGALVADLEDGAPQHRVVVAAELPHELPDARLVVETPQQVPDEHQRVIFPLPRAESLLRRRVARRIVGNLRGLGHRLDPAGGVSTDSYNTRTRKRPSGGAVGPARVRSRPSRSSAIQPGGRAPRPTSTRLPTMFRTM